MKALFTLRLPEDLRKKIVEEALRLLDAIVADIPPLSDDKILPADNERLAKPSKKPCI